MFKVNKSVINAEPSWVLEQCPMVLTITMYETQKKEFWYSRKAWETSEDLEDDIKKGEHKVKALIRRCLEVLNQGESDQFCLLLKECCFQPLRIQFIFF